MINFNGELISEPVLTTDNRAFLFGDGVFETMKVSNGRVLFLEDHYFRLMAAMRIVRMEIPMHFTLDYFESQILELARIEDCLSAARVRITVFRIDGGFYLPAKRDVSFVMTVSALECPFYQVFDGNYEIELYKDFFVSAQLLSSIKTTGKMIHVTGSIFADENGYDNCLLMNEAKNIVEALQGNIFMLTGNRLVTPPVSQGCLNGIMRKQILSLSKEIGAIEVAESPISPFELQKADELFITNVIKGIQPVTKYRKKEYGTSFSQSLVDKINGLITARD